MFHRRHFSYFFLLVALVVSSLALLPAAAQDAPAATATNNIKVRGGPGRDQPQVGSLTSGAAIVLEGRNEDTSWALVHTADNALRGWVAAAYLAPAEGVSLANLPVTDERMAAQEYSLLDALRATPIIPRMTSTAQSIYQRGLELGNNPNRFSKVGDCQNVIEFFLGPFDRGEYNLGPYSDLQTTIDYFAGSFERDSMAIGPGFNVYSIDDPAWATSPCEAAESPQECEYRLWKPSFVIISLEITSGITLEGYESALRDIVEFWIGKGVVPIVATKPDNREGDWSFNAAIARVAWDYDVPLWNFLMATQPLPDFGLTDGFHLTYASNDFGDADKMQSAWPWRNLTALQTLDVMRRAVS
jgi:hypothetical protein